MSRSQQPPLALPSPEPKYSLQTSNDTIGWICLDDLTLGSGDRNNYILGRIGEHNVVFNCPSAGSYGVLRASKVAADMKSSFPWKFTLPFLWASEEEEEGPYDVGKATDDGFLLAGQYVTHPPADVLLAAVTNVTACGRTPSIPAKFVDANRARGTSFGHIKAPLGLRNVP
ncbi:uncharacterized protein BDV17DRAFT_291258 [Aspergillus undulatus]|uniref:uncharacterized protein n=1 Tax=Aspergillus undulatus TaxID=1810928 RepID=UPI003CCE4B9B